MCIISIGYSLITVHIIGEFDYRHRARGRVAGGAALQGLPPVEVRRYHGPRRIGKRGTLGDTSVPCGQPSPPHGTAF